MILDERVDVKENTIFNLDPEILGILLIDRTTNKNIIWATDNYKKYGKGYGIKDKITIEKITGYNGNIIKPRIKKSKAEQNYRTKDKGEVFTPSWVCNKMNNYIDDNFLYKNAFNEAKIKKWEVNNEKIKFENKKDWHKYVNHTVLEMACGEAPFLTSRYDTVTGEVLKINERIGIVDRKMRVINENVNKKEKDQWIEWTTNAFKHIYGFEWQGDSLLITRENLLYTFIDYYVDRFNYNPDVSELKDIAYIISWNIWQMDGLKGVIPYSCKQDEEVQEITLFDYFDNVDNNLETSKKKIKKCKGCESSDILKSMINKYHNGIYSKIKDWDKDEIIEFVDCLR